MTLAPSHFDVRKTEGVSIDWNDGTTSFISCNVLRHASPSADSKALRTELAENPLAILPQSSQNDVTIEEAELVGNYAIRFTFSDGHKAGIYTWSYLKEIGA